VLKSALRMLHAEAAALSLYDRRTTRHHVVAVAAADGHWSPIRSLIARVPAGVGPELDDETSDVVVLPDDDPRHSFASILMHAASAALYVTLRHEGVTLGMLHVGRPAQLRFGAGDRRLARGLADHALLALMTVRIV